MRSILILFCLISLNGITQDFEMSQVKTSQNEDGSISYSTQIKFFGDTSNLRLVVRDVLKYPEFTEAVEQVEVIEKTASTITYYMLYDLPWPLDQRQSTSTSQINYENGEMILFTTSSKNSFNKNEDAITMTNFYEKWNISQSKDGLISILVEGKMDLEGSIPSWMVNSFIPSELKKSYGEIIKRSKK